MKANNMSYFVRIPIAGYIEYQGIMAKDPNEAIEKAIKLFTRSDKTPYTQQWKLQKYVDVKQMKAEAFHEHEIKTKEPQ